MFLAVIHLRLQQLLMSTIEIIFYYVTIYWVFESPKLFQAIIKRNLGVWGIEINIKFYNIMHVPLKRIIILLNSSLQRKLILYQDSRINGLFVNKNN